MLFNGDINYKGKPLFRGGIMNSGSIVPAEDVDSAKAQKVYDTVSQLSFNSIHPILMIPGRQIRWLLWILRHSILPP